MCACGHSLNVFVCVSGEGGCQGKYGLCIVSTTLNWPYNISDIQHANEKALVSKSGLNSALYFLLYI